MWCLSECIYSIDKNKSQEESWSRIETLWVTLCWIDLWPVCEQNIRSLKQKDVRSNSSAPSLTCSFSHKLGVICRGALLSGSLSFAASPIIPRRSWLWAHTQAATLAHIFIGSPFTPHQRVASHSLDPGTPNNCFWSSLRSRPQWLTLNNGSAHTQPVSVSLMCVSPCCLWNIWPCDIEPTRPEWRNFCHFYEQIAR